MFTIRDAATAAGLARASGMVELYSPDGRFLGRFTPTPPQELPDPTPEVVDQWLDDLPARKKYYTPDEVMQRLRDIDRNGQ
jgi:hypothetical protein